MIARLTRHHVERLERAQPGRRHHFAGFRDCAHDRIRAGRGLCNCGARQHARCRHSCKGSYTLEQGASVNGVGINRHLAVLVDVGIKCCDDTGRAGIVARDPDIRTGS
jgi:hypothetical protein